MPINILRYKVFNSMALLLDLLVSGQTRLNDDTYAKNIYADRV